MFAIVQFGSHQYKVAPKDKIKVDKIDLEEGKSFTENKVLLISDKEVKIGAPYINGAEVKAKVISHGRADKIRVFKMKPKKRYRRTYGHRSYYTEIEIVDVKATGAKAAPKKAAPKKAEEKAEAPKKAPAKKAAAKKEEA